MAIDPDGNLWDVEMGPRGGDEINLIQPGKNYGWGDVTYGIEYSGDKVGRNYPETGNGAACVLLGSCYFAEWHYVLYRNIEEWKGNLLIGCLSGEHIARIVMKDKKL
ncbi:hypothetical protein EJ377_09875 [Chryseobacterium arthrosphaerae]|uniref:Glucose/Sorbosone dehydrogenase domain-containing protein n=1 Tax=Chryseobacterium arthrosphaerae TaxID=651561 RepID=A0A432E0W4_9FLAO|nr:hypothetical protein EJ377_09875 [Chryseobacterium arthrosphaerae]